MLESDIKFAIINDMGLKFTIAEVQNEFTLNEWVGGDVAKTWPEGSTVAVRNHQKGLTDKKYCVQVRMWFRPDWVGGSNYEYGLQTDYLLVELPANERSPK